MLISGSGKPNIPPEAVLPIPDIEANVGQLFAYTVEEGTFIDEDEEELLYTIFPGAGLGELPNWITFDPTIPVV